MNVDELVRDAFHEQAADSVPVPPSFADRVLAVRRRRRSRRIASTAAVTAAVIAVAVAVPLLNSGGDDVRPASEMNKSDIIGHPNQSPPKDLIAAGDTVLAAFWVHKSVKQPGGDVVRTRTYGLLDQKTGKYEKAKWAYLDVAPGTRTAAVLEGELPAKRIGLLDMITGKVERWIPMDRGVASVSFSPDGTKLVATTYNKNPDRDFADHKQNVNGKEVPGPVQSRTGFTIVDVDSGKSDWHKVADKPDEFGWFGNSREDFDWSHDGKLVYANRAMQPSREYYDLNGEEAAWPAEERALTYAEAGLSPDGKLAAGEFAGGGKEVAVAVNDAKTGKRVAKLPAQQLLAWADDKRLVAWGCDPERCSGKGEFRNQLLLVTMGTNQVVPLSDFRKASDDYPGRWTPLFSSR
ncbi:WD40 repeat domain-containing protein [Streptomyces albicerus]|uniref:WD40 repeat domain-containing protein n=1 Tax=Streptomyces albicerus TaxID=2569859 RepID=UPI00124B0A6D|nr:WD40 repeat domain-containing protein [Streptomyces albicerus]